MLLQATIEHDVNVISRDLDRPHLLLICIWQKGATALIDQYQKWVEKLQKAKNTEMKVVTKDEVMKECRTEEGTFVDITSMINTSFFSQVQG